MSYQIGQIRKSNNTTYLNELTFVQYTGTQGGFPIAGYGGKLFHDYAIQLANDQQFNANNTYYLRFTLKRINMKGDPRFPSYHGGTLASDDPRQMNIRLQLFKNAKEDSGEYQLGTYQIIESNIQVDPYIQNFNTTHFSFETIFTPNDTYKYLVFILSRVQYDYVRTPEIEELFPGPRNDINSGTIDLVNKGDLCTVNNILPYGRDYVDKIGIQSRPGSLLCINKEAIRIGRSGTYEVNNGVPITFVGFVGPNGHDARNIDKFIFDYAWNG